VSETRDRRLIDVSRIEQNRDDLAESANAACPSATDAPPDRRNSRARSPACRDAQLFLLDREHLVPDRCLEHERVADAKGRAIHLERTLAAVGGPRGAKT
jgi:hypothetical protein